MFYIIGEMGSDFGPKVAVKSLTSQQIVRIHQLFRQAKFDDPSGDVSSSVYIFTLLSHLLSVTEIFWPSVLFSLSFSSLMILLYSVVFNLLPL